MFSMQVNRSIVRSTVCLVLAALIVGASLTFGAMGVESLAAREGIVTITQIA